MCFFTLFCQSEANIRLKKGWGSWYIPVLSVTETIIYVEADTESDSILKLCQHAVQINLI